MAITKKLVDLMGGVINVESEFVIGSKFVVEAAFDIGVGEKKKVEISQELDVSLDGLTATNIMRALPRADAATVPIIAMTADAYEEDVLKTREAGMNAHLIKPINQEELLQTLKHFQKERPCG